MIRIDPRDAYWPYYCEENVWRLIEELPAAVTDVAAVYISNAERRVAVWQQKHASTKDGPMVWDYHVMMIVLIDDAWQAVDLDSRLPLQIPILDYLDASFPEAKYLGPGYAPTFRVIDGAWYRNCFRSDRRHMLRADGSWLASPPPHPPTSHTESNVMALVDMTSDIEGDIFDLAGLRAWLVSGQRP
jgi:hypothetical protein